MKKLLFIFTPLLVLLIGCAGSSLHDSLNQYKAFMNGSEDRKIHEDYLAQIYLTYINQLIDKNTRYATIVGFPYKYWNGFKQSGCIPSEIDNEMIVPLISMGKKSLPYPLPWYRRFYYGYYVPDQAVLPLKIPAGDHDISVYCAISKPQSTLFRNVHFQAGSNYVIYPVKDDSGVKTYIYEYTPNTQFPITSPQFFNLGKFYESVNDDQ